MYIYKITNLENGKIYIGRTTAKNPRRRWTEHKSKAKSNPRTPIEFAIQKYGEINFWFEVIKKCPKTSNLAKQESKFILLNKSLAPNGYNLEVYQPMFFKTKESRQKSSISSQGVRRGSKNPYLGVYESRNKFFAEIGHKRKKISKSHNSLTDAANTYDMLALYLYGKKAKINFEENRNISDGQIKKYFDLITFRKPKDETNIYFDSKRKQWRVRIVVNKKVFYVGGFGDFSSAVKAKKVAMNKHGNQTNN